jgi:hypothetical protein
MQIAKFKQADTLLKDIAVLMSEKSMKIYSHCYNILKELKLKLEGENVAAFYSIENGDAENENGAREAGGDAEIANDPVVVGAGAQNMINFDNIILPNKMKRAGRPKGMGATFVGSRVLRSRSAKKQ